MNNTEWNAVQVLTFEDKSIHNELINVQQYRKSKWA